MNTCPSCCAELPPVDGDGVEVVCPKCGAELIVADWDRVRKQIAELVAAGDPDAITLRDELRKGGIEIDVAGGNVVAPTKVPE